MPFDQAFALSSVLLATMAFSGLVLAQSVPFWLALPMVIILMISALHVGGVHFIRRAIARVTVSPTMWNILLIGAFALLLIDLTVVSRDLLPAGIHFWLCCSRSSYSRSNSGVTIGIFMQLVLWQSWHPQH